MENQFEIVSTEKGIFKLNKTTGEVWVFDEDQVSFYKVLDSETKPKPVEYSI